ncbi:MAG: histidine kinase [Clostridiales bacterium]|nr:histidine kinase [Clostridiales bacterium]
MDQIQYFEWGSIRWIYMPEKHIYTVMNIGIITLKKGKRQNKHVHYSDEQLLYVISGSGHQIINEDITELKSGMIFHMEPGDMHETINDGSEDLVELLISIPIDFDDFQLTECKNYIASDESLGKLLNLCQYKDIVEELYDNILRPLNIPVSVFCADGTPLIKGSEFPEFCQSVCNIQNDLMNCELYSINDEYKPPYYFEHTSFVCKYGITVITIPIIHNKQVVGFIRGGHVREAERIVEIPVVYELPYERPKSSMNTLLRLLIKFQRNIQNFLDKTETEQQILIKDTLIRSQSEEKFQLEESLKSTQSKMLNIQINNHFLFNTLSAIANLALTDGSIKTYDAVINLSKMFRYSMSNTTRSVSLRDEVNNIKDYLDLQYLRFEDQLNYLLDVDNESMRAEVPYNFLQPIVENVFKHAVNHKQPLNLSITCHLYENLEIIVEDDGIGMTPKRLKEIKKELVDKKGRISGLVMVMMKLERLYGDKIKVTIESETGKGTQMKFSVPKEVVMT